MHLKCMILLIKSIKQHDEMTTRTNALAINSDKAATEANQILIRICEMTSDIDESPGYVDGTASKLYEVAAAINEKSMHVNGIACKPLSNRLHRTPDWTGSAFDHKTMCSYRLNLWKRLIRPYTLASET